jgi:DNA-binding NtrC family response regulator
MPIRVLLVENDAEDCAVVCVFLRASTPRFEDLDVHVAHTWRAARVKIVLHRWDVIVINHRVSDATALQMLEALADLPHAPVVVLTPPGKIETPIGLVRVGANEVVIKHRDDWDVELRIAIERIAVATTVQRALEDARTRLHEDASAVASRPAKYGTSRQDASSLLRLVKPPRTVPTAR